MLLVLMRTVCSILVLVGLTHSYRAPSQAEPDPLRPATVAPAPSAASVDSADDEILPEYDQETLYRVCRVTAYCDRGLTAAGVPSGVGQCAAPADIPFGARIYIPALDRTFVVTDRTAKRFRRSTVDLFIPDRGTCLEFGCRYTECQITLPKRVIPYGSARLRAAVATFRS